MLMSRAVAALDGRDFVVPEDVGEIFEYRRWGRDWTGYEGLSVSGLDVVFDNMMDGTATVTSRAGWKWDDVIHDIGMRLCDIAHQDFLVPALTVDDLFRAKRNGQIAFVVSLEAATMIENELDRLDVLYGLGVRVMGITYAESNALGSGQWEANDGGLTHFGRAAVRRMNQLGIAVDVAHSGDRTSLDVIEASEAPVFVTHAGARAVWPTPRMKPDDQLKALAAKGGVIGIEAAPHSTQSPSRPGHDLEAVMAHFEHCVDVMGIDHVAFGPDTLFGDHVAMHREFAHLPPGFPPSRPGPAYRPVPYVAGMENPGEAVANAARWLVAHGYRDEDIRKVLGENVLRVLRAAWR
ncbi:MAG: membrane dipeptidase [Firmicutes bacterium]|nr:membrane dipeptidase [Bacillota bacterium]